MEIWNKESLKGTLKPVYIIGFKVFLLEINFNQLDDKIYDILNINCIKKEGL